MKYRWPDGDAMIVACPKCSKNFETQISVVRELNLSVRPVECDFCLCDFEVYFDGKVLPVSYMRVFPPQENYPSQKKSKGK